MSSTKLTRFLYQFVSSLVLICSTLNAQVPAVDVYLNHSSLESATVQYLAAEYGDEIRLLDNLPRKLTDFTFDYYGDFNSQIGITATLSLYKNDGVDTDPGPKVIPGPGTLLYQSDPILIQPGYHEAVVSGLALDVPANFTWTVRFNGLSGVAGNQAGLIFENPPTIGQSFDDYWQRMPDQTWSLFRLGSGTVANFGARARAFAFPISFPTMEGIVTVSGVPSKVLNYKLDSVVADPGVISVTGKSDNTLLVPDSGIVNGGTGLDRTLQIFPAAGQIGIANITLEATSSTGLSTKTVVKVRVTGTESSIVFTRIPDQSLAVGQASEKIPFEIVGLKEEGGLAGAKITSSNTALLPEANVVVGGDLVNYKLNVQVFPKAGVSGQSTVTIEVTGGSGAKGSTSFLVVVGNGGTPPPVLPEVSIASINGGSEPDSPATFKVTATGEIPSGGLVVAFAVEGTATTGVDFRNLPSTITIPAPNSGNTSSSILTVEVLDDKVTEKSETVVVTLKEGTGYKLSSSKSASVLILDDDANTGEIPKITVHPSSKSEPVGSIVKFEVEATGTEPLVYAWFFNGFPLTDDAAFGISGSKTRVLSVGPLDLIHAGKFTVEVSNATGKALGGPATLEVTSAPPALPIVSVIVGNNAAEPSTSGKFIIGSKGKIPSTGLVVSYSVEGTATAGSDYRALEGSVKILPSSSGDLSSAEVAISVLDDTIVEGTETVVFVLKAATGYALSDSSRATLSILDDDKSTESKPVITNQPKSITVRKGEKASFEVTANGAEPLKYQWKFKGLPLTDDPSIGVSGASTRKLIIGPVQDFHAGPFTVDVSNSAGTTPSEPATLSIESENHEPKVAKSVADQDAVSGSLFTLTLPADLFVDADAGDSLTYSAINLPAWLAFDPATRTFSGTPADADVGSRKVTIVATDKKGLKAETTFSILVKRTNRPPTISQIADQRTRDGKATASIPFRIFDAETAPENLKVTASSTELGLLPLAGIKLEGTGPNRTFTLQPLAGKTGISTVVLTVTDLDGGSAKQEFKLVVEKTAGDSELFLSLLFRVALGREITPAELDSLLPKAGQSLDRTKVVKSVVAGSEFFRNWVQEAFKRYLNRSATTSELGLFNGLAESTDKEVKAIELILLSGEYFNNANGNLNSLFTRWLLDLQGQETDSPAYQQLRRNLVLGGDRPSTLASIQASAETRTKFLNEVFLSYLRRLPSTEESSRFASLMAATGRSSVRLALLASDEFFAISGNGAVNSPPSAFSSTVSVKEGGSTKIALSGFDPDGDPLSFTILTPPSKGTLDGAPPFVSYNSKAGQKGVDSFEFVVNDGKAGSLPGKVVVNIDSPNSPPKIEAPSEVVIKNNVVPTIAIKAEDAETSKENLKFQVEPSNSGIFDPASLVVLNSDNVFSLRPKLLKNLEPGSAPQELTIRVTDADGSASKATVRFTAVRSNRAPRISPTPLTINAVGGSSKRFDVNAVDSDAGQLLSLKVQSTDEKVLSSKQIKVTGENGAWQVEILPAENAFGSIKLGLEVSDDDKIEPLKATRTVAVNILPAPVEITVQPGDLKVVLGKNATFKVEASSKFGTLRYQWKRFGKPVTGLTGANTSQLSISPVTAARVGDYSVDVSYQELPEYITQSRTATLSVFSPPVIVAQPQSKQVVEGAPVTISVEASGDDISYQWHQISAVDGKDATVSFRGTSRSISIFRTKPQDAGSYYCVVSNVGGSVESERAVLTVTPNSLAIVTQPKSLKIQPGDPAEFSVEVTGEGPFNYMWFKNGAYIGNAGKTLTIPSARLKDSAAYTVSIRDAARNVKVSNPATLEVIGNSIPLTDNFADRGSLSGASGSGRASTKNAGTEAGEPSSAYPRTVWGKWQAPDDGVVTFATEGSEMATRVDLFTGTELNNLVQVGAYSEAKSSKNGESSYRARKGETLSIRIQAALEFGSESQNQTPLELHNVLLSWNQLPAIKTPPIITKQPSDLVIDMFSSRSGISYGLGTLTIEATNPAGNSSDLRYTWFRRQNQGLSPIQVLDGTGDSFKSLNIRTPGKYFCTVSNNDGTVTSLVVTVSAKLAINSGRSFSVSSSNSGRSGFTLSGLTDQATSSEPAEVGESGGLAVDTTGATSVPSEPNHCGVVGGASYWFSYQATKSGLLGVNTEGSDFDTVLAGYSGDANNMASLVSLDCNNDISSTNQSSRIQFEVEAGKTYFIAADGVGGATGILVVQYQLTDSLSLAVISDQQFNQDEPVRKVAVQVLGVPANSLLSFFANSDNSQLIPSFGFEVTGTGLARSLAITPTPGLTGSTLVTIKVSDGTHVASRSFNVLVTAPNSPPVIGPILEQSLTAGVPSEPIGFTVSDDRSESQLIRVTATSSDPSKVPAAGLKITGNAANRAISITPAAGSTGAVAITLEAVDAEGAKSSQTIKATIIALTGSPVVLQEPKSVSVTIGSTAQFTVEAGGAGPLQFQWLLDGEALAHATNATLTVEAAGIANQGSYSVQISNGAGATSSQPAILSLLIPGTAAPLTVTGKILEGQFNLFAENLISGVYSVDVTSDFQKWESLGAFKVEFGFLSFLDPKASEPGHRFYRLQKLSGQ